MKRYIELTLIAIISALISIFVYSKIEEKRSNQDDVFSDKNLERETLERLENDSNVNYASYSAFLGETDVDFTTAAESSVHGVVHVKTKMTVNDYYQNPLYEFFFGERYYQEKPVRGYGSGVIISEDGYIVTNNHVVENSDAIEVVLNDKRSCDAEVVGSDPNTDLALLKVEGKDLPYIDMGNSDALKVGEWVLAVGNPFNLTSTVTAGIVSAKARSINLLRENQFPIESFIQTDAAVNRGNSGGALVNLRGELVGINAAISSPTGTYSGYAFAIPVNIVKKIVSDIIKYGEVQRALLGVSIRDVDAQLAEEEELESIEGVYISNVDPNGGAAEAGIKEGDVLVVVNGIDVNSTAELQEQIGKYRPGEKVDITVKRGGKKKQFEVVLRNMHGDTKIIKADDLLADLGAKFQAISSREAKSLGTEHGMKVVLLEGKSKLKRAGIREGFVITYIQGKKVTSLSDITKIISQQSDDAVVEIEGMYPGGRYIYVYQIEM